MTNGSFEHRNGASAFASNFGTGPGAAAASHWETLNNTRALTTTDLLPTTAPRRAHPGKLMIHVVTSGLDNGLAQIFAGGVGNGPANAKFSLWVYVVQGSVGAGAGNGAGSIVTTGAITAGKWVRLRGSNCCGSSPVNELVIYSRSSGVNDFYVDAVALAKKT